MDDWKKKSWNFQQELFRQLGNRKWDCIGGKENLIKKVDFCFELCYGENFHLKENTENVFKKIKEILEKFFDEGYKENFSCTFLNMKMKTDDEGEARYCVFWLQNAYGSEICVDMSGRNYKSWPDFIENNVLPKCYIIYPKFGRYYNECNIIEYCCDIIFEESAACKVIKKVKNFADVITTIGGIAATGVLVFNPVGATVLLGATAVSIGTGIYGVANNVSKLADIHNHEGGLGLDSKTLLTAGELTITALGTAAVGAAAGIKGVAAKTGKVLSEGSYAYKLANNLTKITKIVSGINAGFYMIVIIEKYNVNKCFDKKDLLLLGKVIFFAFNVFATPELLQLLICHMTESFTLDRIIQNFVESPKRLVNAVNKVYKFFSRQDLPSLMEKICPGLSAPIEKFTNVVCCVRRTGSIVDRTCSIIQRRGFEIDDIFFFQKELMLLWVEISNYKKKTEKEIETKFDKPTYDFVINWTKYDGIDVREKDSNYESKINAPLVMKRKVEETIELCCKHVKCPVTLKKTEKQFFSEILNLVCCHGVEEKSTEYIINKTNYYCNTFQTLHRKFTELFHYEYFLYTIFNSNNNKKLFFSSYYDTRDIHGSVYDMSLDFLRQNIHGLHNEFENNFICNPPTTQEKERVIFEFEMPCYTPELTANEFYGKAKQLVPKFETKLNANCTSFDRYDNMVIIKSLQDEFALFFHTDIEDNYLRGMLLFVEDID